MCSYHVMLPHITTRNNYPVSDEVLAEFLAKPASERVVTFGVLPPGVACTVENIKKFVGIGVAERIENVNGKLFVTIAVDTDTANGDTFQKLYRYGKFGFSYRGTGVMDDDGCIRMTEITHMAVLPEKL